jgi:hypothetical protein
MAFGKKQAPPFGKKGGGSKGAPGKPMSKGGKMSKGC